MCKIVHGKINKDGIESIIICIGKGCNISPIGYCRGDYMSFDNNHKKQEVTIYKGTHYPAEIKIVETIKDEVWVEKECLNYLQKNGIEINKELKCKNS